LGAVAREFISRNSSKLTGGAAAFAMTALDTYSYKKEHNADIAEALAYGGLSFVGWSMFSPLMIAWMVKDVATALGERLGKIGYSRPGGIGYREGIGRGFMDNAAKATMRQRAVQALQESRVRGNMILGREASRISRGYFELY